MLSKTIIPYALILFFFTGCASFFETKYEVVTINSTPPGADVYIMGSFAGVTPMHAKLRKASKSVIVDVVKLYYKPNRIVIYSRGQYPKGSIFCSIDHIFGWFLFGIPLEVDKLFSKKCYFLYKTDFMIEMVKEDFLELQIPDGYKAER